VQTLRSTQTLWPAGVVAGIKTEGWVSARQKIRFQALALDTAGKVRAGVALDVKAVARITTTSRKRMVGGFYSYDNRVETKDLGTVCTGKSDARGLLLCDARLEEAGEVELVVTARDKDGNEAQAASSVWVTRRGELWFGGEDHDRIDLLPERRELRPGETARLQVRMPFREATVLVTVEREGILDARVVTLRGSDPVIEVPIPKRAAGADAAEAASWAPNVYVSALVLRGRVRQVPWYSFFDWGWRSPRLWWNAWRQEGPEWTAPTALVDLAKPAFKLGVAALRIGLDDHRLTVKVTPEKPQYGVRQTARTGVQVLLPDGNTVTPLKLTRFNYADSQSHAFRLRLDLPPQTAGVLPGMWLKVQLKQGERQVLQVPDRALLRQGEFNGVYLQQAAGWVLTPVRVGHCLAGQCEILAGLQAGDKLAPDAWAQQQAVAHE